MDDNQFKNEYIGSISLFDSKELDLKLWMKKFSSEIISLK